MPLAEMLQACIHVCRNPHCTIRARHGVFKKTMTVQLTKLRANAQCKDVVADNKADINRTTSFKASADFQERSDRSLYRHGSCHNVMQTKLRNMLTTSRVHTRAAPRCIPPKHGFTP